MKHSNNHTFTSDKLTDKIIAKMDRLKINKSQVIRNCLENYYFKEIIPIERRIRRKAKNGNCPF